MTAPASPAAVPVLAEPLVDAQTVAIALGIDKSSVYRLAGKAGGIPVVEVGPRVRRFRPEDVRAFVAARTKRPETAVEARNLLDSMTRLPVELPRLPGRAERPSRVAPGGPSRAAAGGP
jgi:hypothetical protein